MSSSSRPSSPSKAITGQASASSEAKEEWGDDGDFDLGEHDDALQLASSYSDAEQSGVAASSRQSHSSHSSSAFQSARDVSHDDGRSDDDDDDDLDWAADEVDMGPLQPREFNDAIASVEGDEAEEEDWDRELGLTNDKSSFKGADEEADDEEDEDQVDTIKLSSLAGAALAQLSKAAREGSASAATAATSSSSSAPGLMAAAPITGTITRLGASKRPSVRVDAQGGGDWDEDLELPDFLPSEPVLRRPASFASDFDLDTPSLGSQSDTSGAMTGNEGLAPRWPGSSSSSAASSLVSPPRPPPTGKSFATYADVDDDDESGFDLEPDADSLSLSPSLLRQRSARSLWGDDERSAAKASATDSKDSSWQTEASHAPGDSDADGESDAFDDLELPEELFGGETTGGADAARTSVKERLDAILRARARDEADRPQSPRGEADFAHGLVITDDLDLSPSRLQAKSLSFNLRGSGAISRYRSRTRSQRASTGAGAPSSPARDMKARAGSDMPDAYGQRWSARSVRSPPTATPPSFDNVASTSASSSSSSAGGHRVTASVVRTLRFEKSVGDLIRAAARTNAASADGLGPAYAAGGPATLGVKRSLPSIKDEGATRPTPGLPNSDPHPYLPPGRRQSDQPASARALRAPSAPRHASTPPTLVPDLPPARPSTPTSFRAPPTRRNAAPRISMPLAGARVRQGAPWSPSSPAAALTAVTATAAAARMVRRPRRLRAYGDGHELDHFDDLPTNPEHERAAALRTPTATRTSIHPPSKPGQSSISARGRLDTPATAPPGQGTSRSARRRRNAKQAAAHRPPTLIRNLGTASNAPRVVGDMRWNPAKHKWEGNEGALRDFDNALNSSARPALITPYARSSSQSALSPASGAVTASASTAAVQVVGEMIFDPTRMCWLSRTGEEEPDVFANMSPDEDADEPSSESRREKVSSDSLGLAEEGDGTARIAATAALDLHTATGTTASRSRRQRSSDVRSILERFGEGPFERRPSLGRGGFGAISLGAGAAPRGGLMSEPNSPMTPGGGSKLAGLIDMALGRGSDKPPKEVEGAIDAKLWRECLDASSRHDEEVKGFLPAGSARRDDVAEANSDHLFLIQRLARQAAL